MIIQSLVIATAYLIGSFSTAIIVCRLYGLPDPRSQGSQNPGATNVLRFGGKKAAAITLLGDFLKGLLPVLVTRALDFSDTTIALVGIATVLGHLYPVYFGFKGGKGVATAFGVLLGLSWLLGAAAALTWIILAKLFRISSLAAILTTSLAPLYAWFLDMPKEVISTILVMSIFILIARDLGKKKI